MVSLRSKSLALHAVRSRSINSDTGEDGEGVEPDIVFANTLPDQRSEHREVLPTEMKVPLDIPTPVIPALHRGVREAERGQRREKDGEEEELGEADRLFMHLRDNLELIRGFCKDMVHQIPIPEQCVIEGNMQSEVLTCQCIFLREK